VVFTLVYLSTMVRPMTKTDLGDLLAECRTQNHLLEVTGLLVHHQGQVMQLLEGEQHVVRDLYARIADDPRHHGLFVIWTGLADHRRFPDWTMGFEDLDDQATGRPPRPGAGQQSPLALADVHGTTLQQDYIRRRNAALRRALSSGGRLIRTLGLVLDGHDPEVATPPGQGAQLCCRRCCALTGDLTPFPCPAALNALHDLETGSV